MRCDFCYATTPVWRYKATSFTNIVTKDNLSVRLTSTDDWAACDTCKVLIETNQRVLLTERLIRSTGNPLDPMLVLLTRRWLDLFFEHKTSKPIWVKKNEKP